MGLFSDNATNKKKLINIREVVNNSIKGKNAVNKQYKHTYLRINRIINILTTYYTICILHHCQFGFPKNYSTSYALIHLIYRICSAIDERETTVGVFLDISKAFDTLDYQF